MYKELNDEGFVLGTKPYEQSLVGFVRGYDQIVFDTCSILDNNAFKKCVWGMLPSLRRVKKKISLPYAVVQEIKYLSQAEKTTCKEQAQKADTELNALDYIGMIDYVGDPKVFEQADYAILKYASKERFEKKILVITNDKELANDINMLSKTKVNVQPVRVVRLTKDGELSDHDNHEYNKRAGNQRCSTSSDRLNIILRRFGM